MKHVLFGLGVLGCALLVTYVASQQIPAAFYGGDPGAHVAWALFWFFSLPALAIGSFAAAFASPWVRGMPPGGARTGAFAALVLAVGALYPIGFFALGAFQPAPALDTKWLGLPFEAQGACPFECCTYRTWTVERPVVLRATRAPDAPLAATLSPGESVEGVTGVVVTSKAGRVLVVAESPTAAVDPNGAPHPLHAGAVVHLLHHQGEGLWLAWLDGALLSIAPDGDPTLKVESWPETVWWVQIRTADGREGWSNEADAFGNKDPLRVSTERAANLAVVPAQFRWLAGVESITRYDLPEARSFATAVCKRCGAPVPHATRSGREIIVPAGSLDSEPPHGPTEHHHWDSRAAWAAR